MFSQEFYAKETAFSNKAASGCLIKSRFIASLDQNSPEKQMEGYMSVLKGIIEMTAKELPDKANKKKFRINCAQLECSVKENCQLFNKKGVTVEKTLDKNSVYTIIENFKTRKTSVKK